MLTNLENQLKEQNAIDRLDEVLLEIPRVRKDLGYIPLVTPTSQIVGTQAVINVLTGKRYGNIARETEGVLKGEYGKTPIEVNQEIQERVLAGSSPITCRPADNLEPEFSGLQEELKEKGESLNFDLSENIEDDVLTYALFPQIAIKFFENRDNPSAFEPAPDNDSLLPETRKAQQENPSVYSIEVNGERFIVRVADAENLDVTETKPVEADSNLK